MKNRNPRLLAVLVILGLGGCATHPDSIKATYNDPGRFEKYDCEELAVRIARLDDFVAEQYQELRSDANWDRAQVAVGAVVPMALIFVDGTYGHKGAERAFGRLKGKAIGLRRAAVRKQCPDAERYAREAEAIEQNRYSFGIPDFERPIDTPQQPDSQEDTNNG